MTKSTISIIATALKQTGVNPLVLPVIIKSIANIAYGTKHGKVTIFLINGKITNIKAEESNLINSPALVSNVL